MANIALNKYATESDYENDSTRPTDISTVSLVTGTNIIHYDGVNVKRLPGVVPQVGDALYVDGDGNKFFYSGKSLKASSVPAGQTFLGVVAKRTGRKVKVIYFLENNSVRFVNPCLHRISEWAVGTPIQFKAYKSDWSGTSNLDTTFTPTQSDVAGFTAELSTYLKAHQPDVSADSGFAGAKYDWHAEVLPGPDGNDACYVVSDSFTNGLQTASIVTSGATCSFGIADMIETSSAAERETGTLDIRVGINKSRLAEYFHTNNSVGSPTDSITSGGIISETDFNGESFPTVKAYYGTYDKYLDSIIIKLPATQGVAFVTAGKGKEYTEKMASFACKALDGVTDLVVYPLAAWAAELGVTGAAGVEPGDWFVPSVDEMEEVIYSMSTDGTDVVNKTLKKVNSGYAKPLSVARWVLARYSGRYPWYINDYGTTYATNADFYNTRRGLAIAELEF